MSSRLKKRSLNYNSDSEESYDYFDVDFWIEMFKNSPGGIITCLTPIAYFLAYCFQRGIISYYNVSVDHIEINLNDFFFSLIILLFVIANFYLVSRVQNYIYNYVYNSIRSSIHWKRIVTLLILVILIIFHAVNQKLIVELFVYMIIIVCLSGLYIVLTKDLHLNKIERKGFLDMLKKIFMWIKKLFINVYYLLINFVIGSFIITIFILIYGFILFNFQNKFTVNYSPFLLQLSCWEILLIIYYLSCVLSLVTTTILEIKSSDKKYSEEEKINKEIIRVIKKDTKGKKRIIKENMRVIISLISMMIMLFVIMTINLGEITQYLKPIDRCVAYQVNDNRITPIMKKNIKSIITEDKREYYLYYVVYENRDYLCLKPLLNENGEIIDYYVNDKKKEDGSLILDPRTTTTYIVNKSKVDIVYTFSNPYSLKNVENVKKLLENDDFAIPKNNFN